MEPYAIQLLRRFKAGETLEQLVASEGIPRERIVVRLEAARNFERTRAAEAGLASERLPGFAA